MFSYFYNKEVYIITKTKVKNDLGQIIENYNKSKSFKADIQPMTEKSMTRTWGRNLEATLEMYTDIALKVDDIVLYNNETYVIEARVNWDSYSIYALKDCDINVTK